MPGERVVVGADHAGFALKEVLKADLAALGYAVEDLGTFDQASVDYPDVAGRVAEKVAREGVRGVLVCGTGIGVAIAANRNRAVRAAVCHDGVSARLARQHNDANVLALGARLIGEEVARDCLRVFLSTPFEGGRHARRVAKMS